MIDYKSLKEGDVVKFIGGVESARDWGDITNNKEYIIIKDKLGDINFIDNGGDARFKPLEYSGDEWELIITKVPNNILKTSLNDFLVFVDTNCNTSYAGQIHATVALYEQLTKHTQSRIEESITLLKEHGYNISKP